MQKTAHSVSPLVFSPLYPGYCPTSIPVKLSHPFSLLYSAPLGGCTIVKSTRSPRSRHLGNFQYCEITGDSICILSYC